MQYKLYDIYKMQCILHLSDSKQTVSTPVVVWQENVTTPITQGRVSR